MASSPTFAEAVDPYLRDDETVVTGAVLDGGWLAVTSRRCLVYDAGADRLRAVQRTDVTGVERAVDSPGYLVWVPRLFVYGLVAVGVGWGARRVGRTLSTGLSGASDVAAFRSMLALVGLFRRGVVVFGHVALAGGLLLVLAAVGLGAHWYRSRRPAVAVETVDGTLRVPGTAREVDAATADLRGALGDRPAPGTLFG